MCTLRLRATLTRGGVLFSLSLSIYLTSDSRRTGLTPDCSTTTTATTTDAPGRLCGRGCAVRRESRESRESTLEICTAEASCRAECFKPGLCPVPESRSDAVMMQNNELTPSTRSSSTRFAARARRGTSLLFGAGRPPARPTARDRANSERASERARRTDAAVRFIMSLQQHNRVC